LTWNHGRFLSPYDGIHPKILVISCAGLPDGIFSNLTPQFGKILESFGMENVVISYGHFE
jgi:hypothetical protein